MDQYLSTGGRVKGEWFPESIAGLFRASRTECQDDLECITATMPIAAQAAAAAAQAAGMGEEGEGMGEGEGDDGEAGAAAAAAAAAASVRGSARHKRKTKYERQEAELAAEAAQSKRARLNIKIQQERARLESTKESGYHLRQTLDALRAETQQYEDAIAQTKREMEMIQRETQILEERLAQSRSEYHWGLDQAERIRVEEEKIETILREKLSHVNCFPAEDHEILTRQGFMALEQVRAHLKTQPSLDVACFVEGSLEYLPVGIDRIIVHEGPHRHIVMERKDNKVAGSSSSSSTPFSLIPSDNHRMYARVGTGSAEGVPFAVHSAQDLFATGQSEASAVAHFTSRFELGHGKAEEVTLLPYARALGLTTEQQSDSFLQQYGRWFRSVHLQQEHQAASLLDLSPECRAFFEESAAAPSTSELPSVEGALAPWVWHSGLGAHRARLILAAMQQDGASGQIIAPSVPLRDEIVRLCLHAGYSATFAPGQSALEYVVSFSDAPQSDPSFPLSECREEHKVGTIWCVSVPTREQLIMVRRVMASEASGVVQAVSQAVIVGNTQVNDVSDRVHQLRQLEEEFKLKDVRITQLETEIAKYETQVALLDQLLTKQAQGQVASGPAAAAAASAASAAAAPSLPMAMATPAAAVPASSPTPPSQAGAVPDPQFAAVQAVQVAPATSAVAVPSAGAAAAATNEPVKQEDAGMGVADAMTTPLKLEGEPSAAAAAPAAGTGVIVVDPSGLASAPAPTTTAAAASLAPAVAASSASSAAPLVTSVPPLLPIPTGPNPSLSELLQSIHSSTSTIAHLSMNLKLHEEQLESSNRHLIDRDRAMKYMQEQIERFSNLNHELNYKLKASEHATLEERAKLEQSYKQILFAQRQKEETGTLVAAYEEKLKVFEQLLNVADVRAAAAEEHVGDMMAEVRASRLSNQILQIAYNKLVREYETAISDKYALMQEAASRRGSRAGMHPSNVSVDSCNASEAAASPKATASTGAMGSIKEEGGVAVKQQQATEGINGLASPVDPSVASKLVHFDAAVATSAAAGTGSASSLPAHAHAHDGSADSNAHLQRVIAQLAQQNKEMSIKLNAMTHHNTQLQVALVKLSHRPHKASSFHASNAAPTAGAAASPSPSLSLHASPAAAAAAPAAGMLPPAAAATSPHFHAMKTEAHAAANGLAQGATAAAAPATPERAQAMDIDGPAPAAAHASSAAAAPSSSSPSSSSSALPQLSNSPPARLKSSSGGSASSASALHRALSNSSPLVAPRSPRPPLHPNKPAGQEDLMDL